MNPEATPYDILTPLPPPIVVPLWVWLVLVAVFVSLSIFFAFYIKQKNSHPKQSESLSSSRHLQVLSDFEKSPSKQSARLLLKSLERSLGEDNLLIEEIVSLQELLFAPDFTDVEIARILDFANRSQESLFYEGRSK